MSEKARRQTALLDVIARGKLSSQTEISQLLSKAGFSANQASVSRDLRELGVVKLDGRYVSSERLRIADEPAPDGFDSELITSVNPVGANLIVIRTIVGSANTVAVALDAAEMPDIVGTIAGDDTIFVALRSRSAQGAVLAMLNRRSARH